jgi:hypothetical protein
VIPKMQERSYGTFLVWTDMNETVSAYSRNMPAPTRQTSGGSRGACRHGAPGWLPWPAQQRGVCAVGVGRGAAANMDAAGPPSGSVDGGASAGMDGGEDSAGDTEQPDAAEASRLPDPGTQATVIASSARATLQALLGQVGNVPHGKMVGFTMQGSDSQIYKGINGN